MINPLVGTSNYSATSNNTVIGTLAVDGWDYWYREEERGRSPSPPRPLFAVPNVTAYPSTASVPITVLLYNGPLLCGFNVPVKGLNDSFEVTLYLMLNISETVRDT